METLVRHALPPSRLSTVVDIGCGTGANVECLSEDYSCVGIDPSADAIQYARERFPQVQFVCGNAPDDISDLVATADMFLLMDVLEHVPDDFLLLSSLLSQAKPGAKFLVTVPADMALWSKNDAAFHHYRRYDRERFTRLWRDSSVTEDVVSYYNARLLRIIRLIRSFTARREHVADTAQDDFFMLPRPANALLTRILSGEGPVLLDALAGRRESAYEQGVSLIAVLTRGDEDIPVSGRPSDVPEDRYDRGRRRV